MDVLPATVEVWRGAVVERSVFDEHLDAERFRKAFVTLARVRTTWPAPRDFLEALPARGQLALTKQPIKADPERAAAALAEIAALLGRR